MQLLTSAAFAKKCMNFEQIILLRNDLFDCPYALDGVSFPKNIPASEFFHTQITESLNKLDCLYEDLLIELSVKLGAYHNEPEDTDYWRIIIGPWLGMFVQSNFYKYTILKYVLSNYKIESFYRVEGDLDVPTDTLNYWSQFNSHACDNKVLASMIKLLEPNVSFLRVGPHRISEEKSPKTETHGFIKNTIKKVYWRFNSDDVFTEDFILNIFLKKHRILGNYCVSFGFPKLQYQKKHLNKQVRNSLKNFSNHFYMTEFSSLLSNLISAQFPSCYLENYEDIRSHCIRYYPKNPKIIYASNAYWLNETFKMWAAKLKHGGVPFVISQHGGGYGHRNGAFYERHQLRVSSLFLSWGWSYSDVKHVRPVGRFKYPKRERGFFSGKSSSILLMPYTDTKYPGAFYPSPKGMGVHENYMKLDEFLCCLRPDIRNDVIIRGNKIDNNWQEQKILRKNSGVSFSRRTRFVDDCARARILIFNSNTTGWLDGFLLNIPTFIVLSKKHWENGTRTETLFSILQGMGVLYFNPRELASFFNEQGDDVLTWWSQDEIQQKRREVLAEYCVVRKDPIFEVIFDELRL